MNFLDHISTALRRLISHRTRRKSLPIGFNHPLDLAERHCNELLKPSDARAKYDALEELCVRANQNGQSARARISQGAGTELTSRLNRKAHQTIRYKNDSSYQEECSDFSVNFAAQIADLEINYFRLSQSLTESRDNFLNDLLNDRSQFAAWVHANAARLRQIGMNEKLSDPKRRNALNQLIVKNLLGSETASTEQNPAKVSEALETLKGQLAVAESRTTSLPPWSVGTAPASKVSDSFAAMAENALRWMTQAHGATDTSRETRSTLIRKLDHGIIADSVTLDKGIAQAKANFSASVFGFVRDAKDLGRWIDARNEPADPEFKTNTNAALDRTRTFLLWAEKALLQFHDSHIEVFERRLRHLKPHLLTEAEATLDARITNELFDAVFRAWFDSMWRAPRRRWIDFRTELAEQQEQGLLGKDLESTWQRREARHNLALGAAIRSISPDGDTVFRSDVSLALLVKSRKSGVPS